MQAQQICSLARQIAKCPNYTVQSGQFLNVVLEELLRNYDFDIIRKTYNFSFDAAATGNGYAAGSGPNLMPTDFVRVHRRGSFYQINGVPYTLVGVEQSEFDTYVQQAGNASYPSRVYVDVSTSPAGLYVWTPAAGAYPATIRYNPLMPDIATPESSTNAPWFPNNNYLITRVAAELMKITNDDRLPTFTAMCADILNKYLVMKDDPETPGVKRVALDPRLFGTPNYNRLPNTKQVGW